MERCETPSGRSDRISGSENEADTDFYRPGRRPEKIVAIPPPPSYRMSPDIQRRRKQILYWSYRRARSIWLVSLALGVLLLFVGRTESGPAMGFSLILTGGILAPIGFVGFVAFEVVIWRARVAFGSLSAGLPALDDDPGVTSGAGTAAVPDTPSRSRRP